MRKKLLIIVLICALLVLPRLCGNSEIKHSPGRDTVNLFGDGSFQMLKGADKSIGLFHYSGGGPIIGTVENFCEVERKVYVVGYLCDLKQYGLINLDTNKIYLCMENRESGIEVNSSPYLSDSLIENGTIVVQSYLDFSETDWAIFAKLDEGRQEDGSPS